MLENIYHLNTRHYELRAYLELNQHRFVTAREIYRNTGVYVWDRIGTFTGSIGRRINDDVQFINKSNVFQKIIISNRSRGYKLATKSEFTKYRKSKTKELISALIRLNNLIKQANDDGQMKIVFDQEPNGKNITVSFVDEDNQIKEASN